MRHQAQKTFRAFFYLGLTGLILFEILNVYFIMPMPGSQRMDSLDIAYLLYTSRWMIRAVCILLVLGGILPAFSTRKKWVPAFVLIAAMAVAYMCNFRMAADRMFLQPQNVIFRNQEENVLPGDRLVLGVEHDGDARAYPIELLTYHHQVVDTVGGSPMIVTYCSVCRTGRVYEPVVSGQSEKFRLVGMDHFNAMFEDATTKSWWRQVTGEAVAGRLKGLSLPEVPSLQMTIEQWFAMYPHGLVMQPDSGFIAEYDSLGRFEKGQSSGRLTRTDSLSWNEKSWVIGIVVGDSSRAYDWHDLKRECIINDRIDKTSVVLVLASDGQSFAAFERPSTSNFTFSADATLVLDSTSYNFLGQNLQTPSDRLRRIQAYQEFWHSWRTFHPNTSKYQM